MIQKVQRQRTRLIINVMSNYGAFFIYGAVNFFLVGYVARVLGEDLFGVAMLVISFTMITELLGWGVCLALTKHVAADIGKKDFSRLRGLFSTSLLWLGACAAIGAVICVVLSIVIDRISNIPVEYLYQTRIAMLLMGLRVLICFPFNTFQGILWAYQRYDLTNIARSVGIVIRLTGVVVWFEFVSAGLVELISITIFSLLIERFMWVYSSYKVTEWLEFGWCYISRQMFWSLMGFGGFVLIIQVSNMLGYEAIKWIVNIELPVKDVGAYSLIATMALFAGSMVRSIANVLMPAASSLDALNLTDHKIFLASVSTKYGLIVAGAFCILPLFLLRPFLFFWVGETYALDYLAKIASAAGILLVGQYIMSASTCLFQITTGMGRVSFLAGVTLCWAFCGLVGTWIYLHFLEGSIMGVVIIITIARIAGSVVNLIYGLHIVGIKVNTFMINSIFKPTLVAVIVCCIGAGLTEILAINKVFNFIATVTILGLFYMIGTWFISFSLQERCEVIKRCPFLIKNVR